MLTLKELEKKHWYYNERKQTCECGHRTAVSKKANRVVCSWCGRFLYFDERAKFKDKVLMERRKRNDTK